MCVCVCVAVTAIGTGLFDHPCRSNKRSSMMYFRAGEGMQTLKVLGLDHFRKGPKRNPLEPCGLGFQGLGLEGAGLERLEGMLPASWGALQATHLEPHCA